LYTRGRVRPSISYNGQPNIIAKKRRGAGDERSRAGVEQRRVEQRRSREEVEKSRAEKRGEE